MVAPQLLLSIEAAGALRSGSVPLVARGWYSRERLTTTKLSLKRLCIAPSRRSIVMVIQEINQQYYNNVMREY